MPDFEMQDLCVQDRHGNFLISLGCHYLYGPHVAEMHVHHNLEISCVLSGEGQYHIEDRFYDIRPGDVFVLNNTEHHGLVLDEGQCIRHLVIHFDPAFIWNSLSNDMDYNFLLIFFERGENFSNRLDRDNPATARIFELMQEIRTEFSEQRPCYELIIKIKLQTIFTEIIRNYDYIDGQKAEKPLPENDILQLNAVLRYIDEHLGSEIRLAQLAAIAHVSPAYFSTLFKRFNGLSPVEYIVHKRIQRAIEYIRTTNMTLTSIAMACGFNNSTNFYKAFRKVTGRTPISYRRAAEPEEGKEQPALPKSSPAPSVPPPYTAAVTTRPVRNICGCMTGTQEK